jgi:alkaline phosphatase D
LVKSLGMVTVVSVGSITRLPTICCRYGPAEDEMIAKILRLSILLAALVWLVLLAKSSLAEGGAPLTRIAFGSCAHQEKPQPIWDAVLAYRPELFIFAGDNAYGDVSSGEMTELRAAYARAATVEGHAKLRRTVPVLATWDDHDYGRNDGGGDFPHKAAAKQLFLEFWQVPEDDPRRTRGGIYAATIQGPVGSRVQVILLDTRTFRSPLRRKPERAPGTGAYLPDRDPAKTMLGEAQWGWLEEQLTRPAELRLIVSSVQVLAEGHAWERWGNLPLERDRLLDLVASTGAKGVVFLSGDRHAGALYRQTEGMAYPLYEITSSGINMLRPDRPEPGPHRLGELYGGENFGTIDIDWQAREITLSVRSMSGEPVREVTFSLAQLMPD